MHRLLRLGFVAMAVVAVGACSQKDHDPTARWSKERLFQEASQAMAGADFERAIELFETLEARYPFGPLALQSQLEVAYGYYKFGEFSNSIAANDRFIKLHPAHDSVAYAYYLRGVVRYEQGTGFLNNFFPRDMSQMDQQRLRLAFADFRTVVQQYGDSPYADDARKRMIYLRNQMARHEFETARFYFQRTAYTATLNRIDYLLSNYDGAPIVPDALALQIRAYEALDMQELAADSRRVLTQNWPDRVPSE